MNYGPNEFYWTQHSYGFSDYFINHDIDKSAIFPSRSAAETRLKKIKKDIDNIEKNVSLGIPLSRTFLNRQIEGLWVDAVWSISEVTLTTYNTQEYP